MFASFDLEIAAPIPEGSDWKDCRPIPVSCAAVATSDDPGISFFESPEDEMSPAEAGRLLDLLFNLDHAGYKIVTWNGCGFDFAVLADAANDPEVAGRLALRHCDMMLLVTFKKGWYLSLEAALKGAHLEGKRKEVRLTDGSVVTEMSGAKAPELWLAGERQAVLDYLQDDVLQPLALAHSIETSGSLMWTSGSGRPQVVRTQLLSVAECFQIPKPDTSWMDSAPSRSQFIDWIPADVLAEFGLEPEEVPNAK